MLALFSNHVRVVHLYGQRCRAVVVDVVVVVNEVAGSGEKRGRKLHFVIDVQEEGDAAIVRVVGDVGPTADDGNTLQSRQRNSEGDTNVGAYPE